MKIWFNDCEFHHCFVIIKSISLNNLVEYQKPCFDIHMDEVHQILIFGDCHIYDIVFSPRVVFDVSLEEKNPTRK